MSELLGYVARRLATALPVLIGATIIAFLLGVVAPGDPAREALSQSGAYEPTPEEVEIMRVQLGLDRPLPVQYVAWLGRVVQGDLGTSYVTRLPIGEEMLRRLPVTLQLAGAAILVVAVVGIGGGMLLGYFHNSWLDHLGRIGTLTVLSIPGFWLAIMLIILFAENLRLLPTSGWRTPAHAILPAIVLATGTSAVLMRLARGLMLEVMSRPYITAARARGLPEWLIVFGHVLRNILVPLITVLGTYSGSVIGGTVIVETIFALPGIGRYAVEAIFRRDYPVIQGYVLFTSAAFVGFNLLTDIFCYFIHPQLRLGGRAA